MHSSDPVRADTARSRYIFGYARILQGCHLVCRLPHREHLFAEGHAEQAMDTLRMLSRSTGLKVNKKQDDATQSRLSQSGTSTVNGQPTSASRKRKRGLEEPTGGSATSESLSEDQVRKVQQEQKVKIVDLRKLQRHDSAENRKHHKENVRIFPQPVTSFAQLGPDYHVNGALADNIASQGYYEPTEVQLATLPLLLRSEDEPDLLTVAPTGSGKTLAYLIPAIDKISRVHKVSEGSDRHVSVLIIAPTKELASQIVNEGRKLTANTGVTVTAMRKGMKLHSQHQHTTADGTSDSEQDSQASTIVKADILVSTPLALVHALSQGKDDESPTPLPHIHTLILDEADVLLDPLFRSQTLSIWSACTLPSLRTSLWSATIGSNIEELVLSTTAQRQKTLQIRHPAPLLRTIIGLKDSSLPTISHRLIYAATEQGKLLGLRQLLHPTPTSSKTNATSPPPLRPPFLIFTQTIERATALHTELLYDIPSSAGGPSRIAVLHSSLSTRERSDVMTRFRKGAIWILITTDLLSRGVDFRGINGVVNYDIPTTSAGYVHRAGRTGRAGREGGVCVTFYTKDDIKYVKSIANIIAASEKRVAGKQEGTDGVVKSELEPWLLNALPDLSKKDRKELKERGVETRRAIKESDDAKARKMKRKARIGTKSGYERQVENNRKGAVMGSKRRGRREGGDGEEGGGEWGGIDD